jgi:GT2 family glycosyltransferase
VGCLESLQKQRHAPLEVLVVDDGSTEDIASIVAAFPSIRYLRQQHSGLSAARNLGLQEAKGQIIAYTDDDCMADEEWVARLAAAFEDGQWVACGGPNLPPPPRGEVEAIVAAAPGAPAHVMLDDVEAEHLPGCNLAVRREALEAIGGFRAHYRTAGDDVDVCWRLRAMGGKMRFVPGAMVWHHRRRTLGAYLRQQWGYGEAEALLRWDHPQRFGPIGGARWLGAIYGEAGAASDLQHARIFYGPQGMGLFQGMYQQVEPGPWWPQGLLFGVGALGTCGALAAGEIGLVPAAGALMLLPSYLRWRALPRRPHPLGWWGEVLLWLLCLLQPLVRGWAQWQGMIRLGILPDFNVADFFTFHLPEAFRWPRLMTVERAFWSEQGRGREAWLAAAKSALEKNPASDLSEDDGWQGYDLTWCVGRLQRCQCLTVTEEHGRHRRLTRVRVRLLYPLWLPWLLLSIICIRPWSIVPILMAGYGERRRIQRWMDEVAAQAGLPHTIPPASS